jgi:hypothetical protein
MAVEPWRGYRDMSEARREALLDHKVDEARLRWDLPTAQLVASAVANFEALERAGEQPTAVEKAAEAYLAKIDEAGASGFGKAGGWGHGTGDEAGGWGHG